MTDLNRHIPGYAPRQRNLPSEVYLEGQLNRMKAYAYVKNYIDENWKPGQRFIMGDESAHAGNRGVFFQRKLIGAAWYVMIEWDDKTYKPTGLGGKKIGMFDFYHHAFHEEEKNETIVADNPSGG